MPPAQYPVENLLSSHHPAIRALVEELRQLIKGAVPAATEKAHPRWHSVNYTHPECGYFCGVFPFQEDIKLVFEFGVLLPDPEGLLQGDGKQVRYVHIRNHKDIRKTAIRKLIQAALDLPANRATKLALIASKAQPIRRS